MSFLGSVLKKGSSGIKILSRCWETNILCPDGPWEGHLHRSDFKRGKGGAAAGMIYRVEQAPGAPLSIPRTFTPPNPEPEPPPSHPT